MSRAEAQALLGTLHRAFLPGHHRPRLIWSTRVRKGRADWMRNWIRIGPRCWRGVEMSLLHEYAHIVTGRRRGAKLHHTEPFYLTLVAVTQARFGDPRGYAWGTEYRSLQRRAVRDGYLAAAEQSTIRPAIDRNLSRIIDRDLAAILGGKA